MKSIWDKDACLRSLISQIDEYDMLSFDVFDTILFRICSEPHDVFELVGRRLVEQLNGWVYSPVTYMTLRREAEQRARSRKQCGEDCTLDEILSEMPFPSETIRDMKQLEIDCEKYVLYLNENIYSLIRDCSAKGKRIVLVSDMYHSKEQILDFLAGAGADTGMISGCFTSSEYGCFKSNGELFGKMLAAYPEQNPDRVLHIGDSLRADVEGARKAGIRAIHYNIVPREFGSFYHFEKSVYHIELGEIASIRKLAAVTHSYDKDSEAAFFHAFGAEVIGPVYALFAEWVVRYAYECGIKIILPFMREGELFTKVISRVIEAYGFDIVCTPFFVSRQPAFLSSIFENNYSERISQTLLRGGRTLKTVFRELGLDIDGSGFADDLECTVEDFKANGKIKELEAYLSAGDVKSAIIRYSAEQRRLLLQYLQRLTNGQPALTVDIGTKGTTERYLHDIRKSGEAMPPLSHALMMGSMASNTGNILDGINISAWLGIAGENDSIISKIKYQVQVVETFVNATCGSVLQYEEKGCEILPVQEQENVSEYQKRMIDVCWDGVETFQKGWLTLSLQKRDLCEKLLERKTDFLNILLRFIEMPTKQEAEQFGSLSYFDGYNSRQPGQLSPAIPETDLSDPEIKGFIAAELKNGNYWPQAAIAIQSPGYFNRLMLNSLNDDPSYAVMLAILDEIRTKQYKTGVVFGASELGRKFQKIAEMLDVSIACFVDSDRRLQGTVINGLEVRPLREAPVNVDYFVIASYIYAKEIRTILEAQYSGKGDKPVLFDFGGNNV